jgi:hexosaminidase
MKKSIIKTLFFANIALVLSFHTPVNHVDTPQPQEEISIIPMPAQLQRANGRFTINKETKIWVQPGNADALRIGKMLAEKLHNAGGLSIPVIETTNTPSSNTIYFTTAGAPDSLGEEGYQLSASNDCVLVKALQPAGLFYGMQTIAQLLPAAIESRTKVDSISWQIPSVEITDKPRFTWRGQHLDVCRRFVSVDFIKKYIDNMAMHKLNTFHWHLTEDQGWRLEIKRYPKLTSVGAWRKETLIGHIDEKPKRFDGKRYGGFYTQEQAREIVQYAKDRFITVVPEIEMPGHATAAIAAYPELGVTGKQVDVATYWGVFPHIFNVEESTFAFLENVLSEVISIFPSPYIHIGGDEAIKNQWKASPKIQQKLKALGLKNEEELQSYFMKRIEKFVNARGRKVIGWDEIIEGGLSPNVTVMSWRGMEGGVTAARTGHDVIMAPIQYTYFWWNQGDPKKEPLSAGGYLPMQKVYSFEPIDSSVTPEEAKHVLGAHGSAWSEYMESEAKVEYMVFPRLSALAEVVWTPRGKKNWKDFSGRMQMQFKRYDYRKLNYAKTPLDIGLEKK